MNKNSSPGIGQWLTVTLLVAAVLVLLVKLYQFAGVRDFYPTGLTVAGVDIGGLNRQEASEVLNNRYIEAPILIYHNANSFEVGPTRAEFTLDMEAMLSQADYQRYQQDFWAGFWGFLWGRPVEVEPVPLYATHNREKLREILRDIASLSDRPAQPPQPVPASLSFQYGESGTRTNIEGSFANVEAALYRPTSREAHLIVEPLAPERPNISLLTRLLVNYTQEYEQTTGGTVSIFIYDLNSGEEVSINADVAMSGSDVLRIPVALEAYRLLDNIPTLTQRQLIMDTLGIEPDPSSANQLLSVIAGVDDPYLGASMVTQTMQQMGLSNSFLLVPFGADPRAGQRPLSTPANSAEILRTNPDSYRQMTAEDLGMLLAHIYYCAQGSGGAISAIFSGQITQEECQQMLEYMSQNQIDSLLEKGIPPNVPIAHRHGWISDTHGDAGIIFSPGGNYVIVEIMHKPGWLEWELSSPLMADISRATYNFFNFDNPYLSNQQVN